MINNSVPQVSDTVDTDKSILKIISVILANVILAILSSYFLSIGSWLIGITFFALFLSCLIIQNLFIKGLDKLFIAAAVQGMALALPFYHNFSGLFVLALVVLILLSFKSSFDTRRELEQAMKIRFFRIAKLSINITLPAIIIFLGLMVFMRGNGFSVDSVRWTLQPITPLVERYASNFSPDVKVKDLLNNIASSNLANQAKSNPDLNLDKLPEDAREELIGQGIKDLEVRLETFIGQDLDLDKSVSTNIYEGLNSFYMGLTSTSQTLVLLISLFITYSLIRGLSILIQIPIAFLALVLYEALLGFNFAVIQLEPRSREVIIMK